MIAVNGEFNSEELNYLVKDESIKSYSEGKTLISLLKNSKFEDDQIFLKRGNLVLVLSGVVLNKNKLCKNSADWSAFFLSEFLKKGDEFLKTIRGSFCGFLLNTDNKEVQLFTDHLSTKQVFYFSNKNYIIASTDNSCILKILDRLRLSNQFSEVGALSLLTYGYIMEDRTLSENIFKVPPGTILEFTSTGVKSMLYYKLQIKSQKGRSDNELIEVIDSAFRNAIQLQFEKDKEYGYQHLVGLSGGLDSRMTSIVAHEMGYNKQLNFTFSQSNYLDETIPKKIASDYKHNWLFKSLDNGLFLYDVDETTKISGGNVLYYGLAHANSMYKCIDFTDFGLVHSGQLGDIVVGSILKSYDLKSAVQQHGAYSSTLLDFKSVNKNDLDIDAVELNLFYQRGVYGANCGLITAQQYSETVSPFYDVDFLEACFSIPLADRLNHNIYKKWVCQKYPRAANYVWEKTGHKINSTQFMVSLRGHKLPLKKIPRILLNKFVSEKIGANKSMNPLGYWYDHNSDLRSFLDAYFEKHIHLIDSVDLKNKIEKLYLKGTAIEKNQVVSLLSSVKLFFNNSNSN